MIIDKIKKGNIIVYYVIKDFPNDKLELLLDKKITKRQIPFILNHNADVYTVDGKLLLKFRKNVLSNQYIADFYNNVIDFADKIKTTNRGTATGSKNKNIKDNPAVSSNIIGYYDKMSPSQKVKLRENGVDIPVSVRETRFKRDYPKKYKELIPLIKQIDDYYKELVPMKYKMQKNKAKETPFHIGDTAFSTITTNVNFQTAIHTDKGDDADGFGNLVVIEYGKYEGGETCFPQYGIGVNCRTGDLLLMDTHEAHCNLPIKFKSADAKRLSIVCYLRTSIWKQTKGWTNKDKNEYLRLLNRVLD